jgi:hypothetical protein
MENDRDPNATTDPDLVTPETNPTREEPQDKTLSEQVEDNFEPEPLDEVLPEGTPVDGPAPLP